MSLLNEVELLNATSNMAVSLMFGLGYLVFNKLRKNNSLDEIKPTKSNAHIQQINAQLTQLIPNWNSITTSDETCMELKKIELTDCSIKLSDILLVIEAKGITQNTELYNILLEKAINANNDDELMSCINEASSDYIDGMMPFNPDTTTLSLLIKGIGKYCKDVDDYRTKETKLIKALVNFNYKLSIQVQEQRITNYLNYNCISSAIKVFDETPEHNLTEALVLIFNASIQHSTYQYEVLSKLIVCRKDLVKTDIFQQTLIAAIELLIKTFKYDKLQVMLDHIVLRADNGIEVHHFFEILNRITSLEPECDSLFLIEQLVLSTEKLIMVIFKTNLESLKENYLVKVILVFRTLIMRSFQLAKPQLAEAIFEKLNSFIELYCLEETEQITNEVMNTYKDMIICLHTTKRFMQGYELFALMANTSYCEHLNKGTIIAGFKIMVQLGKINEIFVLYSAHWIRQIVNESSELLLMIFEAALKVKSQSVLEIYEQLKNSSYSFQIEKNMLNLIWLYKIEFITTIESSITIIQLRADPESKSNYQAILSALKDLEKIKVYLSISSFEFSIVFDAEFNSCDRAYEIFEDCLKRNIVLKSTTFESVIKSLIRSGLCDKAITVLKNMVFRRLFIKEDLMESVLKMCIRQSKEKDLSDLLTFSLMANLELDLDLLENIVNLISKEESIKQQVKAELFIKVKEYYLRNGHLIHKYLLNILGSHAKSAMPKEKEMQMEKVIFDKSTVIRYPEPVIQPEKKKGYIQQSSSIYSFDAKNQVIKHNPPANSMMPVSKQNNCKPTGNQESQYNSNLLQKQINVQTNHNKHLTNKQIDKKVVNRVSIYQEVSAPIPRKVTQQSIYG